jgi:hypothetical protein
VKTALSAGLVYGSNYPDWGMKKLVRNLFLGLFLLICATNLLELTSYGLTHSLTAILVGIFHDLSNSVGQIFNMTISTLRTQAVQSGFKAKEVIFVKPTWTFALMNMLC